MNDKINVIGDGTSIRAKELSKAELEEIKKEWEKPGAIKLIKLTRREKDGEYVLEEIQ